jgi:hypothetical protein
MTTKEKPHDLVNRAADHQIEEAATTVATSTEELQFHPLANLFPLIEGAEFDTLVQDIKANGLQERITIFRGMILDGRNRYRAAKVAGIELKGFQHGPAPVTDEPGVHFKQFNCRFVPGFTNSAENQEKQALDYVISTNLHRRHLTDAQRAAIAADIANLGHGGDRSKSPIGDLNGVGQADAAKMLNTSKRAIERAVKRKKADPEAHEAAKAGKVERKPRPKREWKPKEPMCKMSAEQSEKIRRSFIYQRMANFLRQESGKIESQISAAKLAIEFLRDFLSKADPQQEPPVEDIYCDGGQDDEDYAEEPDEVSEPVITQDASTDQCATRTATPEPVAAAEPETVSVKPTICTDPDRLKKLEQWRRQHSKSVYGASTTGGLK